MGAMMNFEDLYKKYKSGTASEEEKAYIEAEIKKNELIQGYLEEQVSFDLPEQQAVEIEKEARKVNKAVKLRIKRIIGFSVLLSIVSICTLYFIISPLMNWMFYKPGKDFTINYYVYSELHEPGYFSHLFGEENPESKGFGKYELTIQQTDASKNVTTFQKLDIVRGKVDNKHPGVLFIADDYVDPNTPYQTYHEPKEMLMEEFRRLPETSIVTSSVSFKKAITTSDLVNLMVRYKELDVNWAAVQQVDQHQFGVTGFYPNGGSIAFGKGEERFDIEKYPYLFRDYNNDDVTADFLDTRYKSMLKYMADHEKFIHLFGVAPYNTTSFYKENLEYVEEHGVNIYGLHVSGNVQDIMSLLDEDFVALMNIKDVRLSKLIPSTLNQN